VRKYDKKILFIYIFYFVRKNDKRFIRKNEKNKTEIKALSSCPFFLVEVVQVLKLLLISLPSPLWSNK